MGKEDDERDLLCVAAFAGEVGPCDNLQVHRSLLCIHDNETTSGL